MPDKSADTLKLKAQKVLDELDTRHLLPFKLTAFRVEWIGLDKYMIYFHDSRLPAIMVCWVESDSFSDVFRSAVLVRCDFCKCTILIFHDLNHGQGNINGEYRLRCPRCSNAQTLPSSTTSTMNKASQTSALRYCKAC
jgi:hypothetical protein